MYANYIDRFVMTAAFDEGVGRQSWSNYCGMAVISLDLASVATWPSAIPSSLAQALTMCRGPLPRSCKSPKLPIYARWPWGRHRRQVQRNHGHLLTDTLIKCGGHDESVDVVGIHFIRFGRVQNRYRPPGPPPQAVSCRSKETWKARSLVGLPDLDLAAPDPPAGVGGTGRHQ